MNTPRIRRLWQRAWQAWLQRQPRTDQHTLTLNNLYVWPTRSGWMLAVVLGLLLVGSINYQLNLGYALTFALAGAAAASVWTAHANLAGARLRARVPDIVFAGQAALTSVELDGNDKRPRWALTLRWLDEAEARPAWADIAGAEPVSVAMPWTPPRRGRWPLPPLLIETRYPLGIVRVWSVWRPTATVLVAPAPETHAPALPPPAPASVEGSCHGRGADADGQEVRPYRDGDAPCRILWRKAAQHPDEPSQWPVRSDSTPTAEGPLWLNESDCGHRDPEARRARLCAWVLQADTAGLRYGLRVGTATVPPDQGHVHRHRCLEVLACA
ncbi:DUF58 domain-containing protein [Tepidimonas charontis]|uniref:DUF58 domain-containing protein n=1 Tax=Tepidimonas charontis TaxID=2267262 RepID=A0A554X7G6_9BURK|nr:DUF58 domain-containing protein [Tepidimonas charontis]TSE31769.1 hypothetical protein Tchar_02250 [Tepidimonas charontis]